MKVKDASEIRRVDVAKPPESKSTRSGDAPAASDKVSTDSSAQLVAASKSARSALSKNHDLRLSEIAAAVKNGTFKPDPQRIAQKILDDAELTAMLQHMLHRG
jgi:negative regulator of flagellin synthesis FlgM